MTETTSGSRICIARLILIPSVITLGVTILRLVGELQHWSQLFFSASAGGGLAIVGISWLPFIFGPYFAVKLVRSGDVPSSAWRPIGFALLGVAIMVVTGFVASALHLLGSFPGGFILFLAAFAVAGILQRPGWPGLFRLLLAYGYAARIPVAILMFFAFQGNWGTHYDMLPPTAPTLSLWPKYIWFGLLPQMIVWVGFTLMAGSLFGGIAAAIVRRAKRAAQAAA